MADYAFKLQATFLNGKRQDLNFVVAMDCSIKRDGVKKKNPYIQYMWEQFIQNFGFFFNRLRTVKYRMINPATFTKKRFSALEKFAMNSQDVVINYDLDKELDLWTKMKPTLKPTMDKDETYLLPISFLIELPEDSKCCSCHKNLSGYMGQKLLNSKNLSIFWKPSNMTLLAHQRYHESSEEEAWTAVYNIWNMFSRYSHMPIVYDSLIEANIISCNNRKCSGNKVH